MLTGTSPREHGPAFGVGNGRQLAQPRQLGESCVAFAVSLMLPSLAGNWKRQSTARNIDNFLPQSKIPLGHWHAGSSGVPCADKSSRHDYRSKPRGSAAWRVRGDVATR